MRRCTKGFTLIELAVILLILAFSVTVVFPRFPGSLDQLSALRSSVNRIANVTEYAHQRAACTRLTHILHIDIEKGTYWIAGQKPDGQDVPITDALNLQGQLPEGIKFVEVKLRDMNTYSRDIATITLSPQGWADPATILLSCSTGETMSIIIEEFSGRVITCRQEEIN